MFVIDKRGGISAICSEVCNIRHDIVCYKLFKRGYFKFTAGKGHRYSFCTSVNQSYVSLIYSTDNCSICFILFDIDVVGLHASLLSNLVSSSIIVIFQFEPSLLHCFIATLSYCYDLQSVCLTDIVFQSVPTIATI